MALFNSLNGVIVNYIRHVQITSASGLTSADLDSMADVRVWLDGALQKARSGGQRALRALAEGTLGDLELKHPLFLYANLLIIFQALLQLQATQAGRSTSVGWATLTRQWTALQAEYLVSLEMAF